MPDDGPIRSEDENQYDEKQDRQGIYMPREKTNLGNKVNKQKGHTCQNHPQERTVQLGHWQPAPVAELISHIFAAIIIPAPAPPERENEAPDPLKSTSAPKVSNFPASAVTPT